MCYNPGMDKKREEGLRQTLNRMVGNFNRREVLKVIELQYDKASNPERMSEIISIVNEYFPEPKKA
jgi:hypothetical protein